MMYKVLNINSIDSQDISSQIQELYSQVQLKLKSNLSYILDNVNIFSIRAPGFS